MSAAWSNERRLRRTSLRTFMRETNDKEGPWRFKDWKAIGGKKIDIFFSVGLFLQNSILVSSRVKTRVLLLSMGAVYVPSLCVLWGLH